MQARNDDLRACWSGQKTVKPLETSAVCACDSFKLEGPTLVSSLRSPLAKDDGCAVATAAAQTG